MVANVIMLVVNAVWQLQLSCVSFSFYLFTIIKVRIEKRRFYHLVKFEFEDNMIVKGFRNMQICI